VVNNSLCLRKEKLLNACYFVKHLWMVTSQRVLTWCEWKESEKKGFNKREKLSCLDIRKMNER